MICYRVTKYNPKFREKNGIYTLDEWTSYSDIGFEFNGKIFTIEEYKKTEDAYINFIVELIKYYNIDKIWITNLEKNNDSEWENSLVNVNVIDLLVRDCLREKIWCKLKSENLSIHFGYDYYMYVFVLDDKKIFDIASKYNLYCEMYDSPYSD